MAGKYIKIYGERNTGTNYLRKLMEKNFNVNLLRGVALNWKLITRKEWSIDLFFQLTQKHNLGWKHMAPDYNLIRQLTEYDDLFILILTKTPYSYLLSLFKRPYHFKDDIESDFNNFLRKEWKTVKRENLNSSIIPNPVELWNIKNRSYRELKNRMPKKVKLLRYIDLVCDPEDILDEIAEEIGENRRNNYSNVESSTKSDEKDYDYYRDYYGNEKWREKLNAESIEIINSLLDPELMEYYNYEVLSTDTVRK